jgi:hypothetical protein
MRFVLSLLLFANALPAGINSHHNAHTEDDSARRCAASGGKAHLKDVLAESSESSRGRMSRN